jgi:seryl-tRNA synthetase
MQMDSEEFRHGLLASRLLFEGGALGLYHRSGLFEEIVRSVEAYVSRAGHEENTPRFFFSPIVPITTLERSGYVKSFPNLLGTINSFRGGDASLGDLHQRLADGDEWLELFSPTEVGLCSAACHPLYPLLVGSPMPDRGLRFEVQASCFRNEPSLEPARLQSFRQHEFVYVGSADAALAHRDHWLGRALELLGDLGLSVESIEANDPFFGRSGRLLAAGQVEKQLKFEVVAPLSGVAPNAIGSANYHEDHFGEAYNLRMPDGSLVHSACFGFGLERITLALIFRHGFEIASWPSEITNRLDLHRHPTSKEPT